MSRMEGKGVVCVCVCVKKKQNVSNPAMQSSLDAFQKPKWFIRKAFFFLTQRVRCLARPLEA